MTQTPASAEAREAYYALRAETAAALKSFVESVRKSGEKTADAGLLTEIKKLETELRGLKKTKRYGLVWENKPETFEAQAQNALPVLQEVPDLAVRTNPEKPENLIIEGDNFHSLAALSYTHKGLVDVIYIDPPYNTGNKDFVYNDRYVDKEDDFRHSKWLSFMEKRLRIARDLLKETGVIFISIDDNEQAQLKMLCDEVFGEFNRLWTIVWKKKTNWNNVWHIPPVHDYILSYWKDSELSDLPGFKLSDAYISANYANPDNDPRGLWTTSDLSANHVWPYYKIINKDTWQEFYPPKGRYWVFNEQETERRISEGRIIFWKSGKTKPVQKIFLNERKNLYVKAESWWDNHGYNEDWTVEIAEILEPKAFTHSKPSKTISYLMGISTSHPKKKNALILDFFAGSGTTGHAVLQLNKEDGGNRRFILCSNRENTAENPDKNLCRDVCYERVKRVSQGYVNAKGEAVEGLGGNLRYFQTAFVPKDRSLDDLRHRFVGRSSDLLRIREDCFDAMDGFADDDAIRAFQGRGKTLAVLYDPYRIGDFKALLRTVAGPVSAYVFTAAPETYAEEFAEFGGRVTLESVPDAILSAYRTIYGL